MTPSLVRPMAALVLAQTALSCAARLEPEDLRQISDQLPIRRVILYQNGVGYFERQGKLDGNVLTLRCRQSQINDLLKSLTVIDRGTGRPVSVSLPLDKSGTKLLDDIPKQVRDASGLLDVLRVFRGARVRVEGSKGSVSGRVVGVEHGLVEEAAAKKEPVADWRLTLKTGGGALAAYPVSAITRIVLQDRALEVGLDQSLDVSLEEGSWKPVTISVRLAGDPSHDLAVSYIIEMPNWKPAYRLVIPDGDRQPLLQGWAVVDNISGESWREVRLSLVAGTPMSFIYDLHAPRFTRRVDLTPREQRVALAPTHEEAGYTDADESTKDRLQRTYAVRRSASDAPAGDEKPADTTRGPQPSMRSSSSSAGRTDSGKKTATRFSPAAMNIMLEKQIKTRVEGKMVGSLFRYDLKDPVTVPDSSSTLVNIVNARVPGGEVMLFRPELTSRYKATHPYRAVKFTNRTGFTLEKGPMTIYSQNTFVGEGFLERMEKGATIFLTYSIDGNVSMTQKHEVADEVLRMLKISRGRIESEMLHVNRRIYSVVNRHERPVVAYVKSTAPSPAYKLRDAPTETVVTGSATYVPLTVPAGQATVLTIEWVSPTRRWIAVDSSVATTVLKLFISSGRVPPSIKPTLDKILDAKARLVGVDVDLARSSQLKSELASDQDRVRANLELMRKVRGNAELKARLTRSLGSLEDRLNKLTARYVKLTEEKARLEGTMRVLIDEITFDATTQK